MPRNKDVTVIKLHLFVFAFQILEKYVLEILDVEVLSAVERIHFSKVILELSQDSHEKHVYITMVLPYFLF